jgi:hypothetical protein
LMQFFRSLRVGARTLMVAVWVAEALNHHTQG